MSEPCRTPPRATYRLQLRGGMDFRGRGIVPYLARLGISHLYLSPPFAAAPGSTHGYDVVDSNRLDPELGGEPGFMVLRQALTRHGLGLILDIVPNHMGIGAANPWWRDVLRHGQASRFAGHFDIDFAADRDGKLVLPVLSAPLDQVLARGELQVALDGAEPELLIMAASVSYRSPTPTSTAGSPILSRPSPTGSCIGVRARRGATIAGSSTSTSSPACGSSGRRCSRTATS